MTVTSSGPLSGAGSRPDTGTWYGCAASSHDARLTEVGPGTPMGEALRRYRHPIACSSAPTSDLPHRTVSLARSCGTVDILRGSL